MRKANYERAQQLSDYDMFVLHEIYQFRCLDINQLFDYYYYTKFQDKIKFEKLVLKKWTNLLLIDTIEYKEGVAVFLTNNAIEIIREEFGMSTNIVDKEKKIVKRGYYSAAELKMLPRLVNHQIHLNRFILDFAALADDEDLNWQHFGEKYVSQYFGMRPDALLRFYDVDIFLEQDMSTESKKQLLQKWEHYRTFLQSKEVEGQDRKIIMMFIVDNTTNIKERKELVRYTACDSLIDVLNSNFDIYVGSRDELLDILFTKIIPTLHVMNAQHSKLMQIVDRRHGFQIRDAGRLKKSLNDTEYTFYLYKTDTNGNLLHENYRLQEFLLDDALNGPFSMISKIAYHKRNSATFSRNNSRPISAIFLVDSSKEVKNYLMLSSLMGTDEVYFTTMKRLETMNFEKALFQFDRSGAIYHFADSGLIRREFEK